MTFPHIFQNMESKISDLWKKDWDILFYLFIFFTVKNIPLFFYNLKISFIGTLDTC